MKCHLPVIVSAALASCAPPPVTGPPPPMMPEFTSTPAPPSAPLPVDDREVSATIVSGATARAAPGKAPPMARPADITLNFPAAGVEVVAQGVQIGRASWRERV
jgi:hypothetical protein